MFRAMSLAALRSVMMGLSIAAPASAQATQPGEYRAGGYPEDYNGGVFYPATELRALPGAKAQAEVAKAELRRAQSNLDNLILDLRRSFVRSEEYQQAIAEEKAAYESLNSARANATRELENDTNYHAAVILRTRLAKQIEDARGERGTTPQQFFAMASTKLSFAVTVTAMEAAASAADPAVNTARQRLMQAGQRVAALYGTYEDEVRTNPAVLNARKVLSDARIAAIGTEALYTEAVVVANVAMDYAYHLYGQQTPYIVNSPYYGNAGGYAVNVGYPMGYPIGWWSSAQRSR